MDKVEKLSGKKVPLHVTDLRDKVAVKKVSEIALHRKFAYILQIYFCFRSFTGCPKKNAR